MKSKDTNNKSLVEHVATLCQAAGVRLCVAESCTGGGLAYALTAVAGSSQWFERGFVTYSNEAKQELLGVSSACLAEYGAVSEQTACQMAAGALRNSRAELSLSITGIAGPGGGSLAKPVGTVCIAFASKSSQAEATTKFFNGDRKAVREAIIEFSLNKLVSLLTN